MVHVTAAVAVDELRNERLWHELYCVRNLILRWVLPILNANLELGTMVAAYGHNRLRGAPCDPLDLEQEMNRTRALASTFVAQFQPS